MGGLGGHFGLLFLITLIFSLGSTLVVIPLSRRVGLVDRPGDHKSHTRPVALGGGIAMFLSLTTVLFFPAFRSLGTLVILAGGGILMVLGLVDDLYGVSAVIKFFTLVVLTLALSSFGIMAHTTRIAPIDLLITVLWVTGISSAFNAIDNADGLASGVTFIAAGTFFVVACQTGQWVFGALSLCLAASAVGFLVMNFPPARVFMGDSGSLFLGFILASLGMTGEWSENPVIAATIPVLVLGYPIFDLSFTVLSRYFRGVTKTFFAAIRYCDTDHTSHRLRQLGLSPLRTLIFLWFLSISFGISAVTLRHALSVDALLHLFQALCITLGLIFVLLIKRPRLQANAQSPDGNETAGRPSEPS